ncbi:hypothetical protein HK405_008862, partial [Cladochytrium tenue]
PQDAQAIHAGADLYGSLVDYATTNIRDNQVFEDGNHRTTAAFMLKYLYGQQIHCDRVNEAKLMAMVKGGTGDTARDRNTQRMVAELRKNCTHLSAAATTGSVNKKIDKIESYDKPTDAKFSYDGWEYPCSKFKRGKGIQIGNGLAKLNVLIKSTCPKEWKLALLARKYE